MAEYRVELKRSAEKELAKLPDDVLARIVAKLEKLATDPRPNGCENLKGGSGEYRVRVGTIVLFTLSMMWSDWCW